MLLKNKLLNIGNLLFKYRGYQFWIYLVMFAINFQHIYTIKLNLGYEIFCFLVAFSGIVIRCLTVGFVTVGTSGRNTRQQEAAELNTTGMYSIVRNPLYISNFLVFFGIIMLSQDPAFVLPTVIIFILYYIPIILAEEEFLLEQFEEAYVQYANEVNCMVPSFNNFKKPAREFSLKMVLMREHDSLLILVCTFLGTLMFLNFVQKQVIYIEQFWIYATIVTLVIWSVLKYMKKYRAILTDHLASIRRIKEETKES